MKPALLVIDMQKRFLSLDEATAASMRKASEYIEWAISLFEKKGFPIVHVVHTDGDVAGPFTEDFWELDPIAAKDRKDVVIKNRGSAFSGTDIEARLRAAGADCVVITGFCAEWCVLSTTRGASDLGWKPMILRGAIASDDAEAIKFVVDKNDSVSAGALATLLG
jgi:nicotinamidase-related amidase